MPLLGRHKSGASPAGSSSSNSKPAAEARNQQVCESPLFGTRRQLPSASSSQQRASSSSTAGSSSRPNSRSSSPAQSSPLSPAGELSSIPQQITRQQIHYAFAIMDLNKDGMIDVRDLSQMLANLGVPIDEAILAHLMSKLSKRGDHRISESEFLDWISNFISVSDSSSGGGESANRQSASGSKAAAGKSKVSRSSTASAASLVAGPAEAPRTRRGSGSGLALMRSLSASAAGSGPAVKGGSGHGGSESASSSRSSSPSPARPSANAEGAISETEDLKNDLKAAFLVFDVDGDGFITLDEVRAGLKLLGETWTTAEVRQVFSRCRSSSLGHAGRQQQQRINIDDFVQLLL